MTIQLSVILTRINYQFESIHDKEQYNLKYHQCSEYEAHEVQSYQPVWFDLRCKSFLHVDGRSEKIYTTYNVGETLRSRQLLIKS